MGAFLEPLVALNAKGMVLENKGIMCKSISSSNGSLWSKVIAAQSLRRRREKKQRVIKRRNLMKRRATTVEGSRCRPTNGMEQKVKTLKKLVPNGKSMMGLDGLFRETADYIIALEMQVKVMQVMVGVLSSPPGSHT